MNKYMNISTYKSLYTYICICIYIYTSLTKRHLKGFLLYFKGDWKDNGPIGSPRLLSGSPRWFP